MTAGSYDEASARRYAAAEARPDSFANRLAPRILRTVTTTKNPSIRVLDIGAGTGQLADALRAAGHLTVAVDYSIPMLQHRSKLWSGSLGSAVAADAAHLPLHGSFDLITATFNVLNHLPSRDSVKSTVAEVARLLAKDGLFIFDINTRLGLEQTQSLTVIEDTKDSQTHWSRHWLDSESLRLRATGKFREGGVWHSYDEVIDKIVLPVSWLEETLSAAGLGNITWVSDDLVTLLDEPEAHAMAFGLARPDFTAQQLG